MVAKTSGKSIMRKRRFEYLLGASEYLLVKEFSITKAIMVIL